MSVGNRVKFNSYWKTQFNFVKECTDSKYNAYCLLCQSSFSLSNMGVRAIISHAKGKKHLKNENAQATQQNLNQIKIRTMKT